MTTFDNRIEQLKNIGFTETKTGMTNGTHSFLWYQMDTDEVNDTELKEYMQQMKLPQNLLAHLRNADANNDGFSYNVNTGESNPNSGYMVSKRDHEKVAPLGCDLIAFGRSYFLTKSEQMIDQNAYMGCWYDGQSFVFDISENVQTKEVAIALGINNGQRAIWDCANGTDILLPSENEREELMDFAEKVSSIMKQYSHVENFFGQCLKDAIKNLQS